MKILLTIIVFLAVCAACVAQAATYPMWVANEPGTGFVSCQRDSIDDGVVLSMLEVTASSDLSMSFWTFDAGGDSLKLISPIWGEAASDTVVTVPAGVTKTFKFNYPRLSGIYVSEGDGYFLGS